MPQDEPDVNNFTASSSHRLPTISGSQALHNALNQAKGISTNLKQLDETMVSGNSTIQSPGIQRGHVTEIYGPPGSGKTAFGLQAVVNTLLRTEPTTQTVWINAGSPLYHDRLDQIFSAHQSSTEHGQEDEDASLLISPAQELAQILDDKFIYYQSQSLPHILALLMHPSQSFPPPDTSLIVIDNLPNLLFSAYPRAYLPTTETAQTAQDKLDQQQSNRRYQIIERLGAGLAKLAASHRIAIVVLSNATTSLRGADQRAVLKSALGGQAWDPSIYTRIVLYRDFCPREHRHRLTRRERRGYRLAEVVRLGMRDVVMQPVPFVIERGGLRALDLPTLHFDDEEEIEAGPSQPDNRTSFDLPPQSMEATNENILAGHDDEADIPMAGPSSVASQEETRPAKRKACEIADSDDDGNDGNGNNLSENGGMLDDEPELPPLPRPSFPTMTDDALSIEEQEAIEAQDEMLLDLYEERLNEDY